MVDANEQLAITALKSAMLQTLCCIIIYSFGRCFNTKLLRNDVESNEVWLEIKSFKTQTVLGLELITFYNIFTEILKGFQTHSALSV